VNEVFGRGTSAALKKFFWLITAVAARGLLVFDAIGVENTIETTSARRNYTASIGE
jgi:hypothetical protein